MRNKLHIYLTVALATVSLFFSACEDDISNIGSSLSPTEVTINVDSVYYNIMGQTAPSPDFESRSAYNLIGSIRVPEYGALDCSYVTRFLPAESLSVPDTITAEDVDSVKIHFSIPKAYITGDTLALQQLKVFSLTRQLPDDISANFNPEGYYDPANPLAVKSYTLSGYNFNDTTYTSSKTVEVKAELPLNLGKEVFNAYKTNPDIFVWPQEFARYWPGIYVAPTFGKGCIAPVRNTSVYAYFPKTVIGTGTDEDGKPINTYTQKADSVCLFSTAPEVLSSVNISYTPSDNILNMIDEGKSIITTPGGHVVSFSFPAKEILEKYWDKAYELGVINNLKFSIPAKQISNAYGLGMPPALLMVKTSEMDSFFADGKLPDNKTSFTCTYSQTDGSYTFNSMRQYIVDLKDKGKDAITAEDTEFSLVPVTISTEDYTDVSTGNKVTVVTSILPYIIMPTMVELDTENALVVFTYSNQILN